MPEWWASWVSFLIPGNQHQSFWPLMNEWNALISQTFSPCLRANKCWDLNMDKGTTRMQIYIYIYMHTCAHLCMHVYIYIYTVKMKVRMPPRIPNIPPPQLECGPRTAKNPSVRMPPHPGFKFFCFWRTLCTNPSLRMPSHYEYHQMLECS